MSSHCFLLVLTYLSSFITNFCFLSPTSFHVVLSVVVWMKTVLIGWWEVELLGGVALLGLVWHCWRKLVTGVGLCPVWHSLLALCQSGCRTLNYLNSTMSASCLDDNKLDLWTASRLQFMCPFTRVSWSGGLLTATELWPRHSVTLFFLWWLRFICYTQVRLWPLALYKVSLSLPWVLIV